MRYTKFLTDLGLTCVIAGSQIALSMSVETPVVDLAGPACQNTNRFALVYRDNSQSEKFDLAKGWNHVTQELYASGYPFRGEPDPVASPEYQTAYRSVLHHSGPDGFQISETLWFQSPTGFEVVQMIGKGSKSVILQLRELSSGKSFAAKVAAVSDNPTKSQINLELEWQTNKFLRKNWERYHLNMIPVHRVGPAGTFLIVELFEQEKLLGYLVQDALRSHLGPEGFEEFMQLNRSGKELDLEIRAVEKERERLTKANAPQSEVDRIKQSIAELKLKKTPIINQQKVKIKEAVLQQMPSNIVETLRVLFEGGQRLALDTGGAHLDLTSNNIAIIEGQAVVFDPGLRTSRGEHLARAGKYTIGENYADTGKLLTFQEWLELFHLTYLVENT